MTPQAYLYICDGDIDNPVLTHKKKDWPEKYPHWQEIPLVMAQQEPVIDKSAAVRIATSLGWEPKRTWQGLTDEEELMIGVATGMEAIAIRMIEAKLKEKNT